MARPRTVTDLASAKREIKTLRMYLTDLTRACASVIKDVDAEMVKPSTVERGKLIAKHLNALEMQNDRARYFGLGIDYRKDKK